MRFTAEEKAKKLHNLCSSANSFNFKSRQTLQNFEVRKVLRLLFPNLKWKFIIQLFVIFILGKQTVLPRLIQML